MIEIKNLKYRYPATEKYALSDISLNIKAGEFVIITGRSGCGKTTLFRCLTGLIPNFYGGVLTGDISVAKLKIQDHPVSELSQYVGYVFQNPENQLFSLNCERDVAFGLENLALPRGEIRSRVDWALGAVDALNLAERMPHMLSSGQQQKVAIATVLAMKPKIILLDEPTANLDPYTVKDLIQLLRRLNLEFNVTLLIADHRLEQVSKYANRILVMAEGKIICDNSPEKVFCNSAVISEDIGVPKVARLHQMLIADGLSSPPVSVSCGDLTALLKRFFS